MHARAMVLLACLAAVPAALSAQQSVRGVVVRAGTDEPIAAASVYLIGANRAVQGVVLSDSAGAFTLGVTAAGRYALRGRRIGYVAAESGTFYVRPDSTVSVRLELEPSAVMLEAITVFGETPKRLTPELEGFLSRRRMHVGYSFSREDIQRLKAAHTVDLLREVPGFVTSSGRAGQRSYALNFRRCPPAIFLDGLLSRVPQGEWLENHSLWNVYGVEVFRDWTSVPTEFLSQPRPRDPDPKCGVILIWTRPPER